MSVKDVIWVEIAQSLELKRKAEGEVALIENCMKMAETALLGIYDLRALLLDVDTFSRFIAYKDTKVRRVKPFDWKKLPSYASKHMTAEQEAQFKPIKPEEADNDEDEDELTAEEKEKRRRASMTLEELADEDARAFMAGKKIKRIT